MRTTKQPCVKKAFATKEAAVIRIAEIAKAETATGKKPVRSYRCPFCKNWHLTSIPKKKFNKTAKPAKDKTRIQLLAAHLIKKNKWDK